MGSDTYILGHINTEISEIPRVGPKLNIKDIIGSVKVRLSINRMDYKVEPGLYAIGNSGKDSNVFASANYKLSFDILRKNLDGLDAWILVLDTKGINVWCAAGKGTFGTRELVKRIREAQLEKIVDHKKIIVPQFGAVGVAAHSVQKRTGFRVVYGPVHARDIKIFLQHNKVTPEMRIMDFPLVERLKLAPVEIVGGLKFFLLLCVFYFLISGITGNGFSLEVALDKGLSSVRNISIGYLCGSLAGPVLLPWVPGRSFAFKGFLIGFIAALAIVMSSNYSFMETVIWILFIPTVSSFMLMNFTGASTYTSLSGVLKEMRIAVPLQIISACIVILLTLAEIIIKFL